MSAAGDGLARRDVVRERAPHMIEDEETGGAVGMGKKGCQMEREGRLAKTACLECDRGTGLPLGQGKSPWLKPGPGSLSLRQSLDPARMLSAQVRVGVKRGLIRPACRVLLLKSPRVPSPCNSPSLPSCPAPFCLGVFMSGFSTCVARQCDESSGEEAST